MWTCVKISLKLFRFRSYIAKPLTRRKRVFSFPTGCTSPFERSLDLADLRRDVEDVAAIHVRALDASVPGNERYLFHSREPMLGDVVANLIRGEFPELGTRVPVGASEAQLPVNIVKTDIAKAEKVFGTEWKSMEITVRDMVHDILDAERDGRADAGNQ